MTDKTDKHFISIELEHEGESFQFRLATIGDAKEWIEKYKSSWAWAVAFANTRSDTTIQNVASAINNFIVQAAQYLEKIDSQSNINHISISQYSSNINQARIQLHNHFKHFWQKAWFLDSNPKIQFVLEKRSKSDRYALMILNYFSNGPSEPSRLNGEFFEAQIDAMIYERKLAELDPSVKMAITKSVTSFESELSRLREQRDEHDQSWKSQLAAIQTKLQEHSENLQNLHDTREKKLDNFINESEESIEAWKKAHREEINLKEPVAFWGRRQRNSLITSLILGITFIAGLIATGYVLVEQSHSIYEGLKIGDLIEYWRVAAMLLLAGLAFWFLRILSKIFLSQLHAWSDAQERVTMVQTYLSLLQDDNGLSDKDRKLILEALFRPAPSGIIKDDGVPPAMFDMITRLK